MLLSLIGLYLFVAMVCFLLLALIAGDVATASDLFIAALVWPYSFYRVIKSIL